MNRSWRAFAAVLALGAVGACGPEEVSIPAGEYEPDAATGVWVDGAYRTLVGHSVTQAPLQNLNFDIGAWLDDLDERGINTAMVWAFMAVRQTTDGGAVDDRFGYVVPGIGPWRRTGPGIATDGLPSWSLDDFDEELYWPRLRSLVEGSGRRGITLWVTVFDGWPKGESSGPAFHPFRTVNGGPLRAPEDFVELDTYGEEVQGPYDDDWSWRRRNQWFQERFADKLAREIDAHEHVILEIFNEGEWYDPETLMRHQAHFASFLRRRTDNPLAVNEDHIRLGGAAVPRSEADFDIASWHSTGYDVARNFTRWLAGYQIEPRRPLVNSETVPAFSGTPGGPSEEEVRRTMWATLLAGGHVIVQDDAAFAYDPAAPRRLSEDLLDQIGHAARFFGAGGYDPARYRPCPRVSTPPYCLTDGVRYLVYAPDGGTVRLTVPAGRAFSVHWLNPRTGELDADDTTVADESGEVRVGSPGRGDWLLQLDGTS